MLGVSRMEDQARKVPELHCGRGLLPRPRDTGAWLRAWGLEDKLSLTQPATGFGLCMCVWIFGASLEARMVPAPQMKTCQSHGIAVPCCDPLDFSRWLSW